MHSILTSLASWSRIAKWNVGGTQYISTYAIAKHRVRGTLSTSPCVEGVSAKKWSRGASSPPILLLGGQANVEARPGRSGRLPLKRVLDWKVESVLLKLKVLISHHIFVFVRTIGLQYCNSWNPGSDGIVATITFYYTSRNLRSSHHFPFLGALIRYREIHIIETCHMH